VTPLLKRVVYPSLAKTGVFRRASGEGLAVLTYHGIRPRAYRRVDAAFDGNLIDAEVFREQLLLLKKNYTVVSPEDVLARCEERGKLPPRAVLLTCDDGLLNNLTDMLPVLQQEGVKCLFFVTGASAGVSRSTLWYEDLFLIFLRAPVGHFEISCGNLAIRGDLLEPWKRRSLWWNTVKQLSRVDGETRESFVRKARSALGSGLMEGIQDSVVERRFGLLVANELRELVAVGMTIGAHTLSHPMLSQCSPGLARAEIAESRVRLETALQTRIWAMAYPFGDAESVNPQVLGLAKEGGYAAAFLNFGGGLGTELPAYAIPRVHVTAEMEIAEFEAHVAGFHAALQRRAGRGVQNGLRTPRG
jgi:peptidoglycan/xylan/chitin deacetylase (PgdA/CDA1 family)